MLATWNWDLSSTYGRDTNDFYTRDTSNPVLYSQTGFSPTDFYDGTFTSKQWTNNLDFVRDFDVGLAGPLSVAVGAEYRRDDYVIDAGIPASYQLGGSAAFQGFSPLDAGDHSRNNTAAYVDLAAKVIGGLRLDIAGRHEHFSDFGNETVGKFTARYDFTPAFAVRGTVSNGFRAPTVAEGRYTKSSTSPTSTGVNLAPNSPAAALFGLGNLQPETSTNYSLGVVFNPAPQFTSTLDAYQIRLSDRIVNSGTLYYLLNGRVVSPLVGQAISINGNQLNPTLTTVSVNLFTNGVDTRTRGVDLVLRLSDGLRSIRSRGLVAQGQLQQDDGSERALYAAAAGGAGTHRTRSHGVLGSEHGAAELPHQSGRALGKRARSRSTCARSFTTPPRR